MTDAGDAAVAGDLSQAVQRDTGIGHPCQARVPETVAFKEGKPTT